MAVVANFYMASDFRQHRTIPALRLKHRTGSCRTSLAVSALRIMRYCLYYSIECSKMVLAYTKKYRFLAKKI